MARCENKEQRVAICGGFARELRLLVTHDVASLCLLVILLPVITLVVVVIVRLEIDVVQHDAEDLRAHIVQQLFRSPHDVPRALAAVDHQQYAVNHRRDQHAIGE